jgi:peptidyl-tRNA hydrolase
MYKQIIIARKDLNMSPGKLAAQVSHGSMAFLTHMIRENCSKYVREDRHQAWEIRKNLEGEYEKRPMLYRRADLWNWAKEAFERGENFFYTKLVNPAEPYGKLELCDPTYFYRSQVDIDVDLYEQWINGTFTKCVLGAKNRNQLLKAKTMAEELGMVEGKDFFLIKDNCYTELEPEEVDENGVGRTLTCIGFRPMDNEIIDKIGKKFQLLK